MPTAPQAVARWVRPGPARYVAGSVAILLGFAVAVAVAWSQRGFDETGPLSFREAAISTPVPGGLPLDEVRTRCLLSDDLSSDTTYTLKIVGGEVDGRHYYGCYQVKPDGSVYGAVVLAADGTPVDDVEVLKEGGAWRWIGTVKTPGELFLGGAGVAAIVLVYALYWRRPRPGRPPGEPWWRSRGADAVLASIPLFGWLVLLALPGRSRARRIQLTFLTFFGWATFFVVLLSFNVLEQPDGVGVVTMGSLTLALLWGWLVGRPSFAGSAPAAARPANPTSPSLPAPAVGGAVDAAAAAPALLAGVRVRPPEELPSFADVGGMEALKTELADTFGLLLAFGDHADDYRISFNGVLLHGPPGVGKTFIARAVAGEFGLNFLGLSVGDLASKYSGETAQNVRAAFRTAAVNVPCVLFFDEFDSIATDRGNEPDQENRRTVNQLLTSLEEFRDVKGLVVLAATNHVDQLDAAVVRPGRFDRRVSVPLPDEPARQAIVRARLDGRPLGEIDVELVARQTEGLTPAAISGVVESAALAAFREATATGVKVPLTTVHVLAALAARGGKDRPTIENWSWDRLVLDPGVKAELQQLQALVENPDAARDYGIEPPTGLLLTGPPGTGKTTIARVLAAEAECSFYDITAADVLSKWVGESEENVARLFTRARENAPSIIFIDEIDAVAARRGSDGVSGVSAGVLNTLLAEMDGVVETRGVFVVGATNRPDVLDPAIVRGGRLSRTIEIPLPSADARRRLLELQTKRMPLHGVDLAAIAAATEGFSGADLEALCQQAAVVAMTRATARHARGSRRATGTAAAGDPMLGRVTAKDFAQAVETMTRSKSHDRAAREPEFQEFVDALTTSRER